MKNLSLILACTIDGGIGYDDRIPWYIPKDMKKFKEITSCVENSMNINAVIMGSRTWESLNYKALPNRINIILTKNREHTYNQENNENVFILCSIKDALNKCCHDEKIENIFIIGGTQIYNIFLEDPYYFHKISQIYLTVLFHKDRIVTNKYINMESIFTNFIMTKDEKYTDESKSRLFASYICIPKETHKSCDKITQ